MTMPTAIRAVLLMIFLALPFPSWADPGIRPGKYVTEGGWGILKILQGRDGTLYFEISSVGSNFHTCDLSGEIQDGMAELEGDDGKPCIVTFETAVEGLKVTEKDRVCSDYCGARASFTALYLKPQPGCDPASVQKTRDDFSLLFDRKDYVQAQAKLEPLLDTCARVIHWSDMGWIRNDLAITRHNLGNDEGCRQALQPLEKDAGLSDDALQRAYSPADADVILPIAAATRTHLKLCAPGAKKP